MDNYSLESFAQWCDDMTIADEATSISINQAKTVSNENALLNAMNIDTPLIKFTGADTESLHAKVESEKRIRKSASTFIWLGLLVAWPFLIPGATKLGERDSKYNQVKKYKVFTNGKDVYIIHKGYKIAG